MEEVNNWLSDFRKKDAQENTFRELSADEIYLKIEDKKKENYDEYMKRFENIRAVREHEKKLDVIRERIKKTKSGE